MLKKMVGVNILKTLKKDYDSNKENFDRILKTRGKVFSLNEVLGVKDENNNLENSNEIKNSNITIDPSKNNINLPAGAGIGNVGNLVVTNLNVESKKETTSKKLSKIPVSMLKEIQTHWEPFNNYDVQDEYKLYKSSYVKIFRDSKKNKAIYNICEPTLNEVEVEEIKIIKKYFRYIFETISIIVDMHKKEEIIKDASKKIMRRIGISITDEKIEKYNYYLIRDFLGLEIIEPLLHDKNIEDISCDGLNIPIYINHMKYGPLEVNRIYKNRKILDSFIVKVAQKCKKEITLSKPILQGKLPDGSRVEAIYGEEISQKGSTFTIRKFKEVPFTPIHLISSGTMPSFLLAYLWVALENKKSVLVSGGTATGKTTVLNALSLFVPPSSKIISIEDTPEINLPHEHWISMVSREESTQKSQVSMFELLKASLRERPDYIIVGEIRGEEANVLFQGIATGHSGLGTVHSQRFDELVNRMTIRPINLPKNLLAEVDIIIFMKQLNIKNALVRRVTSIVEINSYDRKEDKYDINEFVTFRQATDSFDSSEKSLTISKLVELKGNDAESLWTEIEKRKRILDYMKEKEIYDFLEVSKILQKYYESPTKIFDYISSFK